ncbi:MAG TPA: MauE/DoxX family redox-associated membrane protein [bacterium]|nr:DoxX family membrane protein [Candidatus Omnitrophota bacterium]HOJ60221.1 MauE/DoxX family redox-associated membrane protein [bacterium]HOL94018.1 MauE/DoxX family redox-associated membrane protein [bacterium]HPO99990.1 MauE/DoxX family redox-associated membrane protein [bacterium]
MNAKPAETLGGKIMQGIYHPATLLGLRIILGAVLIYAGWIKIFDMPGMAKSIENYRILPVAMVNIPAIVMPPVEIITGLCLILGIWMEGALVIATGLFAVFIVAIQSAILRGLDIECGCFGTSDAEKVGTRVLVRDFLLLFVTLLIWLGYKRESTPVPVPDPETKDLAAESSPEV